MRQGDTSKTVATLFEETKGVLAANVKAFRIGAGMSQEELGLHIGADQSYISHIEAGKFNPTLKSLCEIAAILEVDVRELL